MTSVLRVRDLRVRRGSREIVANAHFDVPRGGIVALMGPSGSGKTTILRAIAGLDRIDGGRIDIGSITLTATPASAAALRALHQTVGFVFQFHHLFEHLSVLDNVCLAPVHVHRVRRADAERRAVSLLELLEVEHRAAAMPRELSGGEAQRVAIARALAVNPPLLMMDEPTASLDSARRWALGELLRRLASENRTILLATHDEAFATLVATAILRVERGTVNTNTGAAGGARHAE
jgi:ABC-type polar amino acid transport system ATPase subunit